MTLTDTRTWYPMRPGTLVRRTPTLAGTPYYPPPTLPTYPIVNYSSLSGATTANFAATLAAVSTPCYIRLAPNTTYLIGDFTQGAWASGGYGCYAPNVMGLICDGTTDPTQRAKISLPAGALSGTSIGKIPTQAAGGVNNLWALRIGPNQTNNLADIYFYGIEFVGHDQANDPNTGRPACWNGLQWYYPGANSTMTWCKLTGFGRGDANSPPGETNMMSTDNGSGMNLYGVEATGYNGDGVRTGGAVSANGTDAIYWENVFVHDTLVSGVTFSTGDGSKPCGTLHTVNLRAYNNANHVSTTGYQFGGVNNEGIYGPVLHENPDIYSPLDYTPGQGGGHFGVQNSSTYGNGAANADVTIKGSGQFWHGIGPSWAYGALTFQIVHNYPDASHVTTQTKMPTIIVDGVTLTPKRYDAADIASINPKTQYCFIDVWA